MGLSPRNLWDMKRFYERYHLADEKLRSCVAVLPWGHKSFFLHMSFHIFTKEGGQIGGQVGGQVQDLIDRVGATRDQWIIKLKRKSNE